MRPDWTELGGAWGFAYDDGNVGRREHWYNRSDVFDRTIVVPFPPESPASGIGDRSRHDVLWYRRTFPRDLAGSGKDVLLHFGAVDYRAQVWVNGHLVASHQGGHTPFSADITDVLTDEGPQAVVVRAEDRLDDRTQPRGKQAWRAEPAEDELWYHRTSGIWQPVWLEPVPRRRISALRWTPDVDRQSVALGLTLTEAAVRADAPPLHVRLELSLDGRLLADETFAVLDAQIDRSITLPAAAMTDLTVLWPDGILWSPDRPHLVDARLTLLDGQTPVDEVDSYFGLRTVGTGDGYFQLNSRPYYLRMVLSQGYWPESQLAAPSGDALRREVELIKSLGFNGVRMHQKIEDPRFLYWCDRLGLLVWAEMPSPYVFNRSAVERFTQEWLEFLSRDYSHPSVAVWVPFNESWGVLEVARCAQQQEFVRSMYTLARTVDPTRPVIGNDGWEHVVTDIWSIHDYTMQGQDLRDRYGDGETLRRTMTSVQPNKRRLNLSTAQPDGEPFMLTEFGGISFIDGEVPEKTMAYALVRTPEAFAAKYEELVSAVLSSSVLAGFCYTQLTDIEQEANGILNADRSAKADGARIRAANVYPSQSVPGELIRYNRDTHVDVSPLPVT